MWKHVVYQHWLKIWDDLRVQHHGWTMMDRENMPQINSAKPMGKPWENEKSWENGKPWDFPWENPWQNPSFSVTFMKIHGKIHEKSIKNPSFS